MAYISLVELKQYIGTDKDEHDTLLTSLIARATAAIEEYVGFTFEADSDSTRTFDARADVDGHTLYFDQWAVTLTTVTNGDGTVIADTYYVTEPRNETPIYAITLLSSSGYAWEYSDDGDAEDAISVLGAWGWSATPPADIQHAALRLVTWMYRQRDNSTDLDRPILADGVMVLPSQWPRDVVGILDGYKRRGMA